MSTGRRSLLIALAGITLWYGGTLVFWAVRPLNDWVPVGVDYTLQPPKKVSAEVECNSVFESAARDQGPLPALTPQPETAPPLDYQREPCELIHSQGRKLFVFDTAAAAITTVILGWVMFRVRRSRPRTGNAVLAATDGAY